MSGSSAGGGVGCNGNRFLGLKMLQWKIGWMCLSDLGSLSSVVTVLIILLMGKGPTYLVPAFWKVAQTAGIL